MPAYYTKVAFRGQRVSTGALVVNTFHVEVDALTADPNWNNVAGEIHDWLGVPLLKLYAVGLTLRDITVTVEDYPGVTPAQGFRSLELPGTRALLDTKLSAAICGLIHWGTDTPKRYARGHTFCPPLYSNSALADGGGWNQADPYYTFMVGLKNAYLAGHEGATAGYGPIIFSKTQVDRGGTPFIFPVTSGLVRPDQHWLRSRISAP